MSERTERTGGDERFDAVGEEFSSAVTRATSVLEEELSAGIASARRLQEKLTADRRVDPAAFDEMVDRVRKDTHSLIDMVVAQVPDGGTGRDLTHRYAADAHDVLDSLLDLARLAPELANGLVDRAARQASPTGAGTPADAGRDSGGGQQPGAGGQPADPPADRR
jgi:hypothetical protein